MRHLGEGGKLPVDVGDEDAAHRVALVRGARRVRRLALMVAHTLYIYMCVCVCVHIYVYVSFLLYEERLYIYTFLSLSLSLI